MESRIRKWNTQSLLWKITEPEVFRAGEYLLAESTDAREMYIRQHIHQIDCQLAKLTVNSSEFISKIRQRFITFEEFKRLNSGKDSGLGKDLESVSNSHSPTL